MSNTTQESTQKSVVNWFEIPVTNIKSSAALYEAMLDTKLQLAEHDGVAHAMLSTSGSLTSDPKRPPQRGGRSTVLYLDAKDGVTRALARAVEAGAKVAQPLIDITPHGFCAQIEDLDGNVIGLHSMTK